jgi:hypothetical protein
MKGGQQQSAAVQRIADGDDQHHGHHQPGNEGVVTARFMLRNK